MSYLEIGDQFVLHTPSGDSEPLTVTKRLHNSKGDKVYYVDEHGKRHSASECWKYVLPAFSVGDVVANVETGQEGLIIQANGRRYFVHSHYPWGWLPEHKLRVVVKRPTNPLTPGDAVMDVKSGHHAVVVKIEGNLAQIDGYSICGWVPVTDLIAVDAVEVENDDSDALLDQHALLSLLAAVEAMIRGNVFEFDLLEVLSPLQKRDLWEALTPDQRGVLKQAKTEKIAA